MKTNKIILPITAILLATLFLAVMPTEAEAAIYEDTVRLHILAESDSIEDQTAKLMIRDKMLEKYSVLLDGKKSSIEAKAALSDILDEIQADCERWITEAGLSYTVKVTLLKEWYDTREYADFTLPAGEYASLKITLGKGEGQNWWCVMYPPLCLDVAVKKGNSAYTDTEGKLISDSGYNVKFKLLEVASLIFGR